MYRTVTICVLFNVLCNGHETTPSLFKWFEKLPSMNYTEFRKSLAKSKHLLVITGGGISEEVGLPIFTEHINYWREYNILHAARIDTFLRSPSIVWEFYQMIRERALKAKPAIGHILLAALEERMMQRGRKMTLITTNIDGLHNLAGSKRLLEMHGSLIRTKCTECGDITENRDSPICPALKDREYCVEKYKNYPLIPENELPRCKIKKCGGLLRPDVLLYGENIDERRNKLARKIMKECDFVIVIGQSYSVLPVGLWPYYLARKGKPVAEFNTVFSKFTADFKFVFRGPCNETLPKALLRKVKKSTPN